MNFSPGIIENRFKQSVLYRSSKLLGKSEKRKVYVIIIAQVGLGLLDLFAVASVGLLGALAINGIQSKAPGNRVSEVLRVIHLQSSSFQVQTTVLGLLAAYLFILRTIVSISFSKRILFFMGRRAAKVSGKLVAEILNSSFLTIRKKSSQDILFSITAGVSSILVQILGTVVLMIADFALLVLMAVGLLIVDPVMALSTFAVFAGVGLTMYLYSHRRVGYLSSKSVRFGIDINERFLEVLGAYREIFVRDRRRFYIERISDLRLISANTDAELNFMPNVGKYVLEATGILGALLLAGVQFVRTDASHAFATLSVFLAAGSRIAPAALRVQQGLLQIKTASGSAGATLSLIEDLNLHIYPEADHEVSGLTGEYSEFTPAVNFKNVRFSYPETNSNFSVENFSLEIHQGEFVALVGNSGSGKSTIADLLLGVFSPTEGSVLISGMPPQQAIKRWPGVIGYVPQNVSIFNTSIKANICLGFDADEIPDSEIHRVLQMAKLTNMVENLPAGIHTIVGENGSKLSGGQRQRLGIARALFTNPKLIVLDEATSSLDAETEQDISRELDNLPGDTTKIVIAHRLSTVKTADKVVYISQGNILAVGKFDEIKSKVPNFKTQAEIMGL